MTVTVRCVVGNVTWEATAEATKDNLKETVEALRAGLEDKRPTVRWEGPGIP